MGNCIYCNRNVSGSALTCPGCGEPNPARARQSYDTGKPHDTPLWLFFPLLCMMLLSPVIGGVAGWMTGDSLLVKLLFALAGAVGSFLVSVWLMNWVCSFYEKDS